MRRREFISLLGGLATGLPFTARAQQRESMRRIGVLLPGTANDSEFQIRLGAFVQALALLGWDIGRNVSFDTRWATSNAAELDRQARELAALAPDVILANGSAAAAPLLKATRTVPIVFAIAADPVGAGLVDSLARPGGNATGQNVSLEFRWAEGQYARFGELAADLVRHRVSVIVTPGSAIAARAAKAASTSIPIVFGVGGDPVREGLVASLNRPGGNATGVNFFTVEVVAKRMQLLRELVPAAKRIAVLVNPADPEGYQTLRDVQAAAGGEQIVAREVASGRDIDAAFANMAGEKMDAVFVGPGTFFNTRRVQLAVLTARYALPAAYPTRAYPEAGGLMSYGADVLDAFRQVGVYTGRILKGAKPADLPVLQSTKFELVINLNTARALGLDVPPTLLARADEVIE